MAGMAGRQELGQLGEELNHAPESEQARGPEAWQELWWRQDLRRRQERVPWWKYRRLRGGGAPGGCRGGSPTGEDAVHMQRPHCALSRR